MARLFGSPDPVQAGEFLIPKGASAAEILDQLQHGQPIRRLVTIPEGMPSILVHERLMAVPYLIGTIPVPNEGSILPDSYSYRRGESRSTVLKRIQEAMTREMNALWAKRQPHSVGDNRERDPILASDRKSTRLNSSHS